MIGDLLNAIAGFTLTNWIAIAALAISSVSLAMSVLTYRRDRPRLKIKCRLMLWEGEPGAGPGAIEVKAINVGRRPIILTMLWGGDESGKGSGIRFDYGGQGCKLGEHEATTFKVTHLPRGQAEYGAAAMVDNDIVEFDRLWIEDSTGKRHSVPDAKGLLRDLGTDYSEWCKETGYWRPPPPAT